MMNTAIRVKAHLVGLIRHEAEILEGYSAVKAFRGKNKM